MLMLLAGCGEKEQESTASYKASDYVTLGEYNGIEVTLDDYSVTDEDVNQYVTEMIGYYPKYNETDKTTVESGDFVDINFEGMKDGVAFDGGTAENYILQIGSNSFIPGFEEGLIGAEVGQDLALDLTFPEDYNSEDLAGQAVVFNVKVNGIVEKEDITLDTLTDEYVKDNFGIETVDELFTSSKTQLEQNNSSQKESDSQNAVLEQLEGTSEVKEIPDSLIDEKVNEYIEQFTYMCKRQYDMELADYLDQNYQMTEEDFKTDAVEFIKDGLDLELIFEAIADKEKMEVDEEGFTSYKQSLMSNYEIEDEEELLKQFSQEYLEQKYLTQKAYQFVLDNAKVTYKEAEASDNSSADAEKEAEEDVDAEKDADKADDSTEEKTE